MTLLKFSDRQIWANSADPDQSAPTVEEQSDLGLHCLLFNLHFLDPLLCSQTIYIYTVPILG